MVLYGDPRSTDNPSDTKKDTVRVRTISILAIFFLQKENKEMVKNLAIKRRKKIFNSEIDFPSPEFFLISSFSVKFSKSHFGSFLEAHNETPRMAECR